MEQFGCERAFSQSEQQHSNESEQQPWLSVGAPLSPAECWTTAEQTAFLQRHFVFANTSRVFLLVQRITNPKKAGKHFFNEEFAADIVEQVDKQARKRAKHRMH